MNEKLNAIIEEKFEQLRKLGWNPSQEDLNMFYETLRGLRDDEVEGYIDSSFAKVICKIERDKKNELARLGLYDSMTDIRKIMDVLFESGLGKYIEVYGGTVPYMISGQTPKRMFGDLDIHVSLDDMSDVRRIIKEHPELFEVTLDTKDEMEEDFGLEIRVNGLDVTLFPAFYTDEGRVVRTFDYASSTNIVTAKETLFYGFTEENATTTCVFDGREVKVETPEIIYCQKSASQREKDITDLGVLEGLVTSERLDEYRTFRIPERLRKIEVERGSYIPIGETTTVSNESNKKNTI